MKIFLTEIDTPFESGILVGPYIRANSLAEAEQIAKEHDLILVAEIHELVLQIDTSKETIH